jgi:hypothetical protein
VCVRYRAAHSLLTPLGREGAKHSVAQAGAHPETLAGGVVREVAVARPRHQQGGVNERNAGAGVAEGVERVIAHVACCFLGVCWVS